MNSSATSFLWSTAPSNEDRDEIVVCPTYLALDAAIHAAKGSNVAIGAQDLHWEKEGAFTGEINAAMLLAVGVTHVIIGHSERRQYFGETDDTVNLKLKSALEAGLIPIVCVGEVLEEREAGLTDDVLRRQCLRAFHKVSAKKPSTWWSPTNRSGPSAPEKPQRRRWPPTRTPSSEAKPPNPSARNSPANSASSTAAPSNQRTPMP